MNLECKIKREPHYPNKTTLEHVGKCMHVSPFFFSPFLCANNRWSHIIRHIAKNITVRQVLVESIAEYPWNWSAWMELSTLSPFISQVPLM
jgi:hypothetical protein